LLVVSQELLDVAVPVTISVEKLSGTVVIVGMAVDADVSSALVTCSDVLGSEVVDGSREGCTELVEPDAMVLWASFVEPSALVVALVAGELESVMPWKPGGPDQVDHHCVRVETSAFVVAIGAVGVPEELDSAAGMPWKPGGPDQVDHHCARPGWRMAIPAISDRSFMISCGSVCLVLNDSKNK